MKNADFEKLLEYRIALMRKVLASKNKEYASDSDKLHNFKRAADMLRCTPEKALIGMATKHIISILDIVDKIEADYQAYGRDYSKVPSIFDNITSIETIEEKIGDAVNYLILLEALLKEREP